MTIRPKVSIGVPVYNGVGQIRTMMDGLLNQTYRDFEIVISDNASTDATASICEDYATQDSRVRYFRQPENVGPERNFKFVLEQARAPYFMWSACDDLRSPEFLEENVRFLEANPDYVASTSPNRVGHDPNGPVAATFSIEGDLAERFKAFFDNCWISHGIFYAVIRTEVLRECPYVGQSFLGVDWAVDIYLASRGNVHRSSSGLMVSGASGISSQASVWRRYRAPVVGWFLPFYRVSVCALGLSSRMSKRQRLSLIVRLLKLNMWAAYSQFHSTFYPFYASHIKPGVRLLDRRRS